MRCRASHRRCQSTTQQGKVVPPGNDVRQQTVRDIRRAHKLDDGEYERLKPSTESDKNLGNPNASLYGAAAIGKLGQ